MNTDKNIITGQRFAESVAYLLRETFEGSPEGQASAYLDRGIGLFKLSMAFRQPRRQRKFRR
jgi:hypothetical protein